MVARKPPMKDTGGSALVKQDERLTRFDRGALRDSLADAGGWQVQLPLKQGVTAGRRAERERAEEVKFEELFQARDIRHKLAMVRTGAV